MVLWILAFDAGYAIRYRLTGDCMVCRLLEAWKAWEMTVPIETGFRMTDGGRTAWEG
jgi:hypothetical protein